MKILLIIFAVVFITGCANLMKYERPVNERVDTIKAVAPLLDTLTGGWATPISGAAGTLLTGIFAWNRAMVAKRRGQAIKEINANPETPHVSDQVNSAKAQKVIIQLVGIKEAELKEPPLGG